MITRGMGGYRQYRRRRDGSALHPPTNNVGEDGKEGRNPKLFWCWLMFVFVGFGLKIGEGGEDLLKVGKSPCQKW